MTRRERLERRAERRRDWAESRKRKAEAAFRGVEEIADRIPLRQPILVGHHSERKARKDQDRIHAGMRRGVEHNEMARRHEQRAAGLEAQLDRSVFSDDADAIDQLKARIAEREAARERGKRINAAWRKAGKPDPLDPEAWAAFAEKVGTEDTAFAERGLLHQRRADVPGLFSWAKPYDPKYDGANIRRDRERIEEIKLRQATAEKAEAAGGVLITYHGADGGWCRVTFSEKPDHDILNALRTAGYSYGGGIWSGHSESLPPEVKALAEEISGHGEQAAEQ